MKLVYASLLALALASSTAHADTKKVEEISQADGEKFMAFFNKFVDLIVANKDNCPKMASGLNALIDANLDIIKKANESKKAGKRLPKALEEKMMARVKETMPAMAKCGEDKDVKSAIDRMKPKKEDKAEKQ